VIVRVASKKIVAKRGRSVAVAFARGCVRQPRYCVAAKFFESAGVRSAREEHRFELCACERELRAREKRAAEEYARECGVGTGCEKPVERCGGVIYCTRVVCGERRIGCDENRGWVPHYRMRCRFARATALCKFGEHAEHVRLGRGRYGPLWNLSAQQPGKAQC
jgi:hypothetical protein